LVDGGEVKRALVIGAGFIGLEMAENLHARGIQVTVIELAKQALAPLDFEMAAMVHQELKRQGISLHLEASVAAFDAQPNGRVRALLAGGGHIDTDLVLLSIGVRPNTAFLAGSGIELGARGHIVVDPALRTSVPSVYAAGDAIEVRHPLTGKRTAVPLAGPANKQGRIVAGNMSGIVPGTYVGTFGTAIAKVFDLDVAMTGATEKFCRAEAIPHRSVIIHPNDHAGYYPGATQLTLKLVFSPDTRKVLGAQAIGQGGVDKRIDVLATAIKAGMTIDDLTEIEHAYAPPYSSAKDPVNMAGFVAQNLLDGLVRSITWDELQQGNPEHTTLLDVRSPGEFAAGTIPGAVNIPLDTLRQRLTEIPTDKPVIIICRVGLRGYLAARILMAHGRNDCVNLSGGYLTWQFATQSSANPVQQLTACNRRDAKWVAENTTAAQGGAGDCQAL